MGEAVETAPLWDVGDVATYLKASKSWVYKRTEDGTLPCVRVCGLLRFEPAAVVAYARGETTARVVSLTARRRRQ